LHNTPYAYPPPKATRKKGGLFLLSLRHTPNKHPLGNYVNLPLVKVVPPNGTVGSINLFSYNGTLAYSTQRGGIAFTRTFDGDITGNRAYILPDKSGTVALLSDLSPNNLLAISSLCL